MAHRHPDFREQTCACHCRFHTSLKSQHGNSTCRNRLLRARANTTGNGRRDQACGRPDPRATGRTLPSGASPSPHSLARNSQGPGWLLLQIFLLLTFLGLFCSGTREGTKCTQYERVHGQSPVLPVRVPFQTLETLQAHGSPGTAARHTCGWAPSKRHRLGPAVAGVARGSLGFSVQLPRTGPLGWPRAPSPPPGGSRHGQASSPRKALLGRLCRRRRAFREKDL